MTTNITVAAARYYTYVSWSHVFRLQGPGGTAISGLPDSRLSCPFHGRKIDADAGGGKDEGDGREHRSGNCRLHTASAAPDGQAWKGTAERQSSLRSRGLAALLPMVHIRSNIVFGQCCSRSERSRGDGKRRERTDRCGRRTGDSARPVAWAAGQIGLLHLRQRPFFASPCIPRNRVKTGILCRYGLRSRMML